MLQEVKSWTWLKKFPSLPYARSLCFSICVNLFCLCRYTYVCTFQRTLPEWVLFMEIAEGYSSLLLRHWQHNRDHRRVVQSSRIYWLYLLRHSTNYKYQKFVSLEADMVSTHGKNVDNIMKLFVIFGKKIHLNTVI